MRARRQRHNSTSQRQTASRPALTGPDPSTVHVDPHTTIRSEFRSTGTHRSLDFADALAEGRVVPMCRPRAEPEARAGARGAATAFTCPVGVCARKSHAAMNAYAHSSSMYADGAARSSVHATAHEHAERLQVCPMFGMPHVWAWPEPKPAAKDLLSSLLRAHLISSVRFSSLPCASHLFSEGSALISSPCACMPRRRSCT